MDCGIVIALLCAKLDAETCEEVAADLDEQGIEWAAKMLRGAARDLRAMESS